MVKTRFILLACMIVIASQVGIHQ